MARTQQKLINYHSSGNTEIDLQYLDYGEIAVRHNPENPQLIVKTGENTKATFVDSASVVTMIDNKMSSSIEDIEALKTNVSGLTDDLNSLSGEVETYKTIVDGQIEAIVSGVTQLSGYVETDCATKDALASANTRIDTAEENIAELSGSVESMSADVKTYIDNKLSVVYKFKGTKNTYEDLPAEDNVNGDVWNVISGHGTTPPGTNYAWVAESNSWDALGGSIDLSGYATVDALSSATTRIETAEENIETISGHVVTIKPIAESALQGFELTGDGAVASTGNKTQQSGVVADFTSGGTATLDLSGIIIDCGNW